MGKKNKLYAVVFSGVYPDGEGDHSVGIYTKKSDALKEFRKQIAETKKYYRDELEVPFNFYRGDDWCSFRVEGGYDDAIEIFIIESSPDDGIKSFVF